MIRVSNTTGRAGVAVSLGWVWSVVAGTRMRADGS